jgi:hypothetical protein
MILQQLKKAAKSSSKFTISDLLNTLDFDKDELKKALEFLLVSGKIEKIGLEPLPCASNGCSGCSCPPSYYDTTEYKWVESRKV